MEDKDPDAGASGDLPPGADASQASRPEQSGVSAEDAALLAELRKRTEKLKDKERREADVIARNWESGQAQLAPVAMVDDWVRRVALLGDDLFVGTSRSGVRRYRLGEQEPRQRLPVSGNDRVGVPADHQALEDPETSVTSLAWDGCWLAAGLAGGRFHVWDADGAVVVDTDFPIPPVPCYVALTGGAVVAASGCLLLRRRLAGDQTPDGAEVSMEVPSRIHCLESSRDGGVVIGLEDGSVELRNADLKLTARHAVHLSPVSAVCVLDEGLITGDATGQLARWQVDANGNWQTIWRAQHEGRVVAIQRGGAGTLVTGALDGTVRAWWADSGTQHFVIKGHKVWLGSICTRDDKGIMVTDGRDNAVYMYDFCRDG